MTGLSKVTKYLGLKVTCTGSPGHGSKFIENTAAEKLVGNLEVSALIAGKILQL